MKVKLTLFIALALLPLFSFAQSSLTIFSEDGDKFFLVLNGQKQNAVAQTNVRIDGLPQPYYSAKILFEDQSKPEISKNIPVQDPQTNAPADVTYKIKRTKDGELKIRYFSAVPVQPNYVAPPDVYVMHYGQPAPPPPASTTVTQTTVTTTNATVPGGNVSVGVNGGDMGVNMNMNINIQDPNAVAQTTTTTTRTTSYSSSSSTSYDNAPAQPSRAVGCQYAMDWSSFKSAKETVAKASFEDTKLSTAKTILSSNCFSTDQVVEVCKLFGYEATKLEFAKFAYSKTTDPGNYFKVGTVFDFDASKTELNEYISNGR